MKLNPITFIPLIVCTNLALATDYYQDASHSLSTHNWDTLQFWNSARDNTGSDPTSINAADNFFTNGFVLRSPNAASGATFGGNSITIELGGTLQYRGASDDSITVSNLNFDNGTLANVAAGANTVNATNVTVSQFNWLQSVSGRELILNFTNLSGGATSTLKTGTSGTGVYTFTISDGTAFEGTLDSTFGTTRFTQDTDLSSATWFINTAGNPLVELNHSITVSGLNIGGDVFSAGTYSFSDLNTSYDSTFIDGGTGSITVVPEPSSFTMITAAIVGLYCAGRRSR